MMTSLTPLQELKGWFFLIVSLCFLAVICGIALLGTVTRPDRWCERSHRVMS